MKLCTLLLLLASVCMLAGLSGCRSSIATPQPSDFSVAEAARPSDASLSQKYQRSCLACHGVSGSNAPLARFTPAWDSRLVQGLDTLVQHAREGYKSMPARGYCNDCSDDELRRLIEFMATREEGTGHG